MKLNANLIIVATASCNTDAAFIATTSTRVLSPFSRVGRLQMKRLSKSEMGELVNGTLARTCQTNIDFIAYDLLSSAIYSSDYLGLGLEQPKHTSTSRKKRRKQAKRSYNPDDTSSSDQITTHKRSISLDHSPTISLQTQLDYARKGHAVLRSFLPSSTTESLRSELLPYIKSHELQAWRQKVEVQLGDSSDSYQRQNARSIAQSLITIDDCQDMLESLGLDTRSDLPFMQHFNIWRDVNAKTPVLRTLCLSSYVAQAASILLDAPTVRLYQDSLFHKRPGDGWTPYHSVSGLFVATYLRIAQHHRSSSSNVELYC